MVKSGRERNRYLEASLERRADRPRSGRHPTYTDADRKAMCEPLRDDPPAGHNRQATPLQWDATANTILVRLAQIRRTYEMMH